MIPQIIWLFFSFLVVGMHVAYHGQKRDVAAQKYNAGGKIFDLLIVNAVLLWGGFYAPFFDSKPATSERTMNLIRGADGKGWLVDPREPNKPWIPVEIPSSNAPVVTFGKDGDR